MSPFTRSQEYKGHYKVRIRLVPMNWLHVAAREVGLNTC